MNEKVASQIWPIFGAARAYHAHPVNRILPIIMFATTPVRYPLFIYSLLLMQCACLRVGAQDLVSFNLNSRNGLPSDHVYSMTIDHFGYLWICTDKGVIRYNGYEQKLFSMTEGLPAEDIWGILEDKKGRMWLCCSSDEIGYIYNNKYYKANTKGLHGTVFPYEMRRYDSGIIFSNPSVSSNGAQSICVERNDTIYSYQPTKELFHSMEDVNAYQPRIIIGLNKKVNFYFYDTLYQLDGIDNIVSGHTELLSAKKIFWMDRLRMVMNIPFNVHGRIVCQGHTDDAKSIIYIDPLTGKIDSLDIRRYGVDEGVELIMYTNSTRDEDDMLVHTRHYVLVFTTENGKEKVHVHDTREMLDNNDGKKRTTTYTDNTIWGTCISTLANGVFMLAGNERFHRAGTDLAGCRFVGSVNDMGSVWWNADQRMLLYVENDIMKKRLRLPGTVQVNSIVELNKDTLLLAGTRNYYVNKSFELLTDVDVRVMSGNTGMAMLGTGGRLHCVTRMGVYTFHRYDTIKDIRGVYVDVDRYAQIAYDRSRGMMWAYNHKKILQYNDTAKRILNNVDIPGVGSNKIDRLCIDERYGNVFIKSTDMLLNYDPESGKCSNILPYINMKKVNMDIYGQTLVLYGDFGVLFALVTGKGAISEPIIYYNTKKTYYKKHLGHGITNGRMTLQTDMGTYEIVLPGEQELAHMTASGHIFNYNLLLTYDNKTRIVANHDTVSMDQLQRAVQLDIVNPAGNGAVSFWYRIPDDSIWHSTASGEIVIPDHYEPDNYYKVQVYYTDDAWKSDPVSVYLYISPYWWQTRTMRVAIWTGSIILALSIIVLSIFITRRLVLRAAQKKQLQMEMELKAIYAQINPHFIFNTLTSALLLVSKNRMDEAYAHISKFSKLLRSYLRSSRNKYILLTDEIDNLRNYTELQQTRFKDRFVCNIIVAPTLEHASVKIPSLLIQPFVENAINHGMLHSSDQGILTIEFRDVKEQKMIQCIVSDNGIGRERSRENKKESTNTLDSYGNLLIKDLVSIFNKYEDMKIEVAYEDMPPPDTGTIVIISITDPPRE